MAKLRKQRRQELIDEQAPQARTEREPRIELDTTEPAGAHYSDDDVANPARRRLVRNVAAGAFGGLVTGAFLKDRASDVRAEKHEQRIREARDIGFDEGARRGLEVGQRRGEDEATEAAFDAFRQAEAVGSQLTRTGTVSVTFLNGAVTIFGNKADRVIPYPVLVERLDRAPHDISGKMPETYLNNKWLLYQEMYRDEHGEPGIRMVPVPFREREMMLEMYGGGTTINDTLLIKTGGAGESTVGVAQIPGFEFPDPAFPRYINTQTPS